MNPANARDGMSLALDPALFMEKVFGIEPDDWQKKLLRDAPSKVLLLCSRQAGKSTVSAVLALYYAVFYPDSLILIISRSFRQSEELFRKVKGGISYVTNNGLVGMEHETQRSLNLSNGSRILSLPGRQETVRAYSKVSYLIIDEASQVPDDLYSAVRPMLAVSKGNIIAMTTPYGKRGWFYNSWKGTSDWYRVKITAYQCPRISDEFIRNEVEEVGDWWVKQEYFCEFVDAENQLFSYDSLVDAVDSKLFCWA